MIALLLLASVSVRGEAPPAARTWHAALGVAAGGDGSAERPFLRLSELMAAAGPGDVLMLRGDGGDGAWAESLHLEPGQRVEGSTGARLRPTAGAGLELAAGVTVADLAIVDAPGAGVVARDVIGVRLRGVTVTGSAGPAVLLERATDVELTDLVIEDSGGSGIVGHEVRDLRLIDGHLSGAGDEDGEDAIRLVDPQGRVRLTRCVVTGGHEDLVDVEVGGGEVQVVVEDSELSSPGPGAAANDGILFRMTGGTGARLEVAGTDFSGIPGNAIDASGESSSGPLRVAVEGGSFADSDGSALALAAGEEGTLVFRVVGASFERLAGTAFELTADDHGHLEGSAAGNRIEEVASGAVVAFADEQTTAVLALVDNELRGAAGEAFALWASGAARVDLLLAGNTLGAGAVILEAADDGELCLDLEGASAASTYRLTAAPTARLELAGREVGALAAATATAALRAEHPSSQFEIAGEPSIHGVAACRKPSEAQGPKDPPTGLS